MWTKLPGFAAYREFQQANADEIRRRRDVERALIPGERPFKVEGYCWTCRQPAAFEVDFSYAYPVDGVLTPNWREHLRCPQCGLHNRMRASVHFLEEKLLPSLRKPSVYITEQTTPLFHCLAARLPRLVGSEYFGDAVPFGEATAAGIRNESITKLSFADESFDCVISFEVLEHVPDYARALAEVRRVLRPGGWFFFSAPFRPDHQENLLRAVVEESGEIRHLLPPEYHGDPLQTAGCLAFHHFGWELLDHTRSAGFGEANVHSFWSRDFGYIGDTLYFFLARKPAQE